MALAQGASLDNRIAARYRHKEVARKIVWLGISSKQAIQEAGYSDSVAGLTLSALAKACPTLYLAIKRELADYVKVAEQTSLSSSQTKVFVRDKLTRNVLEGTDKGVQSAKLLAELDGFKAPDNAVNISFNAIPAAFQSQARQALEGEIASEVLSISETPSPQPLDNTPHSE
jgi:hypothetical protein